MGRASPDPLRLVEAGYRWVTDDRQWLQGIAEAAEPCGTGSGVGVYTLDLTEEPVIEEFVGQGTDETFEHEIRAFTSSFDRDVGRMVYAPTEFVGNSRYRIRRIAKDRQISPETLTGGHNVAAWALVGGDPRRRVVALTFPGDDTLEPESAFPRARVLGLAAAHLGAALRLRQLAAPLGEDDTTTESVLDPRGRVLHAEGEARDKRARSSLVEAVVERERARGSLRRVDPDEAASLWSVLVAGRWSIVDFVDRDGKRMLLARKNPVNGPDVLALTDEERDVLWLATLGHSHKYIAYELGLGIGTVTRRLRSAMRKLRIPSRRDLLRALGMSGRSK